jgi:uncharacterized repeat protein (TIGR01451 family)
MSLWTNINTSISKVSDWASAEATPRSSAYLAHTQRIRYTSANARSRLSSAAIFAAFALFFLLSLTGVAAQTAPGTVITNTAEVSYTLGGSAFTEWSNTDSFIVEAMGGGPTDLRLSKRASRIVAAIGESVQFTIRIENVGLDAPDVVIHDRLPGALRYRSSVPASGTLSEFTPAISEDGGLLIFSIGALAAGQVVEFAYIVEISAGTDTGFATNKAQAYELTSGRISNVGSATVLIRQDLFADVSFVAGRVTSGGCGAEKPQGVAGVRLYLEDGTVVMTDPLGRYHVEGLKPGLHVVQLDRSSLPPGLEPVLCKTNTRNGGAPDAQFVDTQGGTLWRVDFVLSGNRTPEKKTAGSALPTAPLPMTEERLKAWIESAPQKFDIVAPATDFYPQIRSIEVVVAHKPTDRVELLLNGKPVSPLNYDGKVTNGAKTWSASRWRGIDIQDGDNTLVAIAGGERLQRVVHFASEAVDADIDEAHSVLFADGKTAPVVAVWLSSLGGHPARGGTFVDVGVDAPHRLAGPTTSAEQVLSKSPAGRTRHKIGAGGIALVQLAPTVRSGEVKLRTNVGGREIVLTTWLAARITEPLLTGLADGTLGYNSLSGNPPAGSIVNAREHLYADGRVAFFFKSMILGDWLLKAGYDSDRTSKEQQNKLFREIEPGRYFPIYGDASTTEHEAESSGPLFMRIERGRFYAQLGDFDTPSSQAQLTRYQRRLHGVQTVYRGEEIGFDVSVSDTKNRFIKDEIEGNGTSGLYRLSTHPIVINSERITIETRDRFRNGEIVSSRILVRHIDYEIDYELGTLFFKEPVPSQDFDFNPLVIVAEYETLGDGSRTLTYGGRVAAYLDDNRGEIGVTLWRESSGGNDGTLYGVDAKLRLFEATTISAELAGSKDDAKGDGQAYRIELVHEGETFTGRLYARDQDEEFGLGQLNQGLAGSREMGAEARVRLDAAIEGMGLQAKTYRRESDRIDGKRDFVEILVNWAWNDVTLQSGYRHIDDSTAGANGTSNQLLLGASYKVLQNKMTLRATREQNLPGTKANPDFPTRTVLGVDYQITQTLSVVAAQEFMDGPAESESLTRVGFVGAFWPGGRVTTSAERQLHDEASRVFANFGLSQTLQIEEKWSVSASIDRQQRISGYGEDNGGLPDAPGAQGAEFTAISIGTAVDTDLGTFTGRAETRLGSDERWNLAVGHYLAPYDNLSFANRLRLLHEMPDAGTDATTAELQLGVAYRPNDGPLVLGRLDFGYQGDPLAEQKSGVEHGTWKIVANTIVNLEPDPDLQLSLQLGLKYANDVFGADDYQSFTALTGAELRYDITEQFDLGLRASALITLPTQTTQYSFGPSLGYSLTETIWMNAGFNVVGFEDEDFSAAGYSAAGPFVQLRMRFQPSDAKQLAAWLAAF